MFGKSISETDGRQVSPCLYLLYHELRSVHTKYSYAIETAAFETHANLIARLRKDKNSGVSAEFTFDDGHASDFTFAWPILSARNFSARFFITVGWTGQRPGYMGWSELRSLHDAGHTLGTHGWSHALLTHCSPKELDHELRGSRNLMEDKLGVPITTMSLPGGRYNKRVLAACQKAGYTKVYTSVPRMETTSSGLIVGRLNICSHMTLDWIERLLQPGSRELSTLRRHYRMKTAAKSILRDWLYDKLWTGITRKEPDDEIGIAVPDEDSTNHQ